MCFDSYEDRGDKEFDPCTMVIARAVLVVPCLHHYRHVHLKRFFLILFRQMLCNFQKYQIE